MKRTISIIAALAALLTAFSANAQSDGPYILYNPDGSARMISVDKEGRIHDGKVRGLGPGAKFTVISDSGEYSFDVTLHKNVRPDWEYAPAEKTFVMSDPHANLECFISVLQGNNVIDENLHWSFGTDQVIILGDISDRGVDATQIYWLVYQLQTEAEAAGGRLSFIYGNHETMVLAGDLRYTKDKYKNLADSVGVEFPELMGPDTELGRWLATRNTIEKIGSDIFVHAGLSSAFVEKGMSVPEVNELMSKWLFNTSKERKTDDLVYFLFKSDGPVWYRGLVRKKAKYNPASNSELAAILKYFGADRVFVGHTIFRDVRPFYRKKVIAVNVSNPENMAAGRTRAALIDHAAGTVTFVGDRGPIKTLR